MIGGELASVQNPMIKYAIEAGWEYVPPDEAARLRGGGAGFVFREILTEQITRFNSHFITPEITTEVIRKIEMVPPNIEGNLIAWEYLKGFRTAYVTAEKCERNVILLDTKNIRNNTYHVTDEFSFTNGSKTIRPDIVCLINGIPIIIIETKAAHKREGMVEALKQIKRYHRQCPELLSVLQLYAITHIIKYYYSGTWNTSRKLLFNWKEEVEGNFETLVKAFLDKERVIKVLSDYLMFAREDDELKKIILRPHQMRAVRKILERAAEDKSRALIWHTQGSGKTYTMMFAAKRIIENPQFENPTVIMLVDRNELESQLFGHLASAEFEVEVADSKKNLRKLLAEDRKGLIVTMIHKFDKMPEKINLKKNIFILVDEAHRTTGGKLGNYLMGAIPNATYMGFTGTPIDKSSVGTGTFVTFGKDDPPHGYLDRYSIAESIDDGTTVPLHYTLAPNVLQVDKDTLNKEFLELSEAEGISDIGELNKILERAVTLRNMLKNTERMQSIAKYVANHFTETIEPLGYKAFLVAVDREACSIYKTELDKYLPKEYSEVVYSPAQNDSEKLTRFHLSKEEEKRIRKAFRDPEKLPKILIVTEKLLTGFDAPVLYCMYLDKPMRDHVLLQAIARVNRPYENKQGKHKPSGFVLDFVGIFDNLEKALAFDSIDIEGVVHDIEVLKGRFAEMIHIAQKEYLSLIKGKIQDKAVEAVLEHFLNEEERQAFYQFFKEISDIYDIISPDAFLRPFLDEFEIIARMYRMVKEAYDKGISVDLDFSKKTAKLVQKHTKSGSIKSSLDVYEIDGETIKKIEEANTSDTEKVFNLLKSIERVVVTDADAEPYLISIGDKAELLAQLYKNRQETTKNTLEKLKEIIKEINDARKEQAARNMTKEIFSIFWTLKREGIKGSADRANDMNAVLEKYPHWRTSEAHERNVKQELYGVLINSDIVTVAKVKEIAQKIMRAIKGGAH